MIKRDTINLNTEEEIYAKKFSRYTEKQRN